MRDKELDIVYRDYSFEPDMPDKEKQACMGTIFQIQNDEIQNDGRYLDLQRSSVKYCCEMFSMQNAVRLVLKEKTIEEDRTHWYAKCPYCESMLNITENGVTVDELNGNLEEYCMRNFGREEINKESDYLLECFAKKNEVKRNE